ncbi:hypothetical protein V8F33_013204 [Rhypophila sp. PSN 637]
MNRSQFVPHTAYTITPYHPRFGVPGYHNVPAVASATPLAYPAPTYIQQPHHHHQVQQPLYASPYGGSTSVGAYAPVAGQIEDIVSPPPNSHPSPPGKHHMSGRARGHIPNGIHPSSLPQVQDVFAPRQPQQQSMATPFGAPMPISMPAPSGTSRMVGAYPPTPQQPQQQLGTIPGTIGTPSPVHSQQSSPTMGMPHGAHDLIKMQGRHQMRTSDFPPPQSGANMTMMGMGMVQLAGNGPGPGYGQFTTSP